MGLSYQSKNLPKNNCSNWGFYTVIVLAVYQTPQCWMMFSVLKEETFSNYQVMRILHLNKWPFLLFTSVLFSCRSSCWNRQWMPEFAVWFSGLLPLWRMSADFWPFSLLHLAEQASFHALYLQFTSCVNNPWSEICYTSLTLPTTSKIVIMRVLYSVVTISQSRLVGRVLGFVLLNLGKMGKHSDFFFYATFFQVWHLNILYWIILC